MTFMLGQVETSGDKVQPIIVSMATAISDSCEVRALRQWLSFGGRIGGVPPCSAVGRHVTYGLLCRHKPWRVSCGGSAVADLLWRVCYAIASQLILCLHVSGAAAGESPALRAGTPPPHPLQQQQACLAQCGCPALGFPAPLPLRSEAVHSLHACIHALLCACTKRGLPP